MIPATELQRRLAFEGLVLQALWFLLLFAVGRGPRTQLSLWRGNALAYLDEHGNQSSGAPAHRREIYPEYTP